MGRLTRGREGERGSIMRARGGRLCVSDESEGGEGGTECEVGDVIGARGKVCVMRAMWMAVWC